MRLIHIFVFLLISTSCSLSNISKARRDLASISSLDSCIEIARYFHKPKYFKKSGIEFEGLLPVRAGIEEDEEFLIVKNHIWKKVKEVFPDAILDENDSSDFLSYEINGETVTWVFSTESFEKVDFEKYTPLEISSTVLENEKDRQLFWQIFNSLKDIGVKAYDKEAGIHIHHDAPDLDLKSILGLYRGYKNVNSAMKKLFNTNPSRSLIDDEVIDETIDEIKDAIADGEEVLNFGLIRGPIRYTDLKTIELRIFNSSLDAKYLAQAHETSDKLLEALLDHNSNLSRYIKNNPNEDITPKKLIELLNISVLFD